VECPVTTPVAITAIEAVLRGELVRCEDAIRNNDQRRALSELEHAFARIEAALVQWREDREQGLFGL
jgi:hypothetical protein